jgi:hypothetical protein
MRAFWGIALCNLVGVDRRFTLMMEAVRTSERSVYPKYTTRNYILEGFHLQCLLSFWQFRFSTLELLPPEYFEHT